MKGWEGRWGELGAIGGVDGMGGKDVIGDVEEGWNMEGIGRGIKEHWLTCVHRAVLRAVEGRQGQGIPFRTDTHNREVVSGRLETQCAECWRGEIAGRIRRSPKFGSKLRIRHFGCGSGEWLGETVHISA